MSVQNVCAVDFLNQEERNYTLTNWKTFSWLGESRSSKKIPPTPLLSPVNRQLKTSTQYLFSFSFKQCIIMWSVLTHSSIILTSFQENRSCNKDVQNNTHRYMKHTPIHSNTPHPTHPPHTDRQKQTSRQTDTETQTDRQRHRHTDRQRESVFVVS